MNSVLKSIIHLRNRVKYPISHKTLFGIWGMYPFMAPVLHKVTSNQKVVSLGYLYRLQTVTKIGPKLLSMDMPIPNFCSWNRHGDSKSRSSEFRIPIEFRIPNFCPWNRHGNSMSRSSEFGIPIEFRFPNFCPWNRHSNSMSGSSEFRIPYPILTFLGK